MGIEILDDPASNPFYSEAVDDVQKIGEGKRFRIGYPAAEFEQRVAALRFAANDAKLRLYSADSQDDAKLPVEEGITYGVFKLRPVSVRKPKSDGTEAFADTPLEGTEGDPEWAAANAETEAAPAAKAGGKK